jgi:hypothetical protein
LAGGTRGLKQYGIALSSADITAEALSSGAVTTTKDPGKIAKARLDVSKALEDETAAIKKFGPASLQASQAAMQLQYRQGQLLKAMGGVAPKLTSAQKAQAIYSLVLKRSTGILGAHNRQANKLPFVFSRIRASLGNLVEQFGLGLLPVVRKVADALDKKLANPKFRIWMREMGHLIGTTLVNAFVRMSAWFQRNWPAILAFFRSFGRAVHNVAGAVSNLANALGSVASVISRVNSFTHGALFKYIEKDLKYMNPLTGGYNIVKAGVGAAGKAVHVHGPVHVNANTNSEFLEEMHRLGKRTASRTRGRHKNPIAGR